MSFTADEKLDLVEILGITPAQLDGQLMSLSNAGVLTPEILAKVRSKIGEWTTIGKKFIAIEPNIANLGARIDPELAKTALKTTVAGWLGVADIIKERGSYRILRG